MLIIRSQVSHERGKYPVEKVRPFSAIIRRADEYGEWGSIKKQKYVVYHIRRAIELG